MIFIRISNQKMTQFVQIGGPLWSNGPTPGGFYNFPGGKTQTGNETTTGRQRDGYVSCRIIPFFLFN